MTYTYEAGTKATLVNASNNFFDCEPTDTDTAYEALAESLKLNDQSEDSQDLVDFENAQDDDVETLLNDMQKMGFIASWEAED